MGIQVKLWLFTSKSARVTLSPKEIRLGGDVCRFSPDLNVLITCSADWCWSGEQSRFPETSGTLQHNAVMSCYVMMWHVTSCVMWWGAHQSCPAWRPAREISCPRDSSGGGRAGRRPGSSHPPGQHSQRVGTSNRPPGQTHLTLYIRHGGKCRVTSLVTKSARDLFM